MKTAGTRGTYAGFALAHVKGDDGLIHAIVERAQELRPEKCLEAAVLQDVAESVVCHAGLSAPRLPKPKVHTAKSLRERGIPL